MNTRSERKQRQLGGREEWWQSFPGGGDEQNSHEMQGGGLAQKKIVRFAFLWNSRDATAVTFLNFEGLRTCAGEVISALTKMLGVYPLHQIDEQAHQTKYTN